MILSWFKLVRESALLALDAQQVIGLRVMKIAGGGPAAQSEAVRMITEKVAAAAEAVGTLPIDPSGRRAVRRYRTRVKANRRRLTRRA